MRRILLITALCIQMTTVAFCSEMVLKSGQKMEGKIVEQTDQYIKFDMGKENEKIVMTFFADEIDTIDGQKMSAVGQEALPVPAPAQPTQPVEGLIPEGISRSVEIPDLVEPVKSEEIVSEEIKTEEVKVVSDVNQPATEIIPPAVTQTLPEAAPAAASPTPAVSQKQNSLDSLSKIKVKINSFCPLVGVGLILVIIALVFYMIVTYPIYKIALKLNEEHAWLAWIPLVQFYTICKMGKRPYWVLAVFVLSYVPIVGIIFMILSIFVTIYMWMGVAQECKKSKWLGILSIVPIANFILIWYLALSD